ncbi:ESPR domain-containing protein, partial [Escherichia coli]|nr:ESPR domain-containing protein [Escherichia coli]EKG7161965.1 ESPR domain-containing protein [Escherichia coli]
MNKIYKLVWNASSG